MTVLYQTKMCDSDKDEVDRIPSKDRATNWDIAGFVISIISHIVDVFFDCNLAYRYYMINQSYFLATLAFIIIPAIINTAFSLRMYVLDHENQNKSTTLTKRFTKRRICCIVVLLFQLAPILRYFDALLYAIKSKKAEKKKDIENQRKYYDLMVKEDSDVALLRVLECFLEAAPQQILQLGIIFYNHGGDIGSDTFTLVHQMLSIGSSFVSMAWSMASYQRLLRVSLRNKQNITWAATIVQFMWHFLVTVSRILCISVLASIYPVYTILGLLGHWLIMTVWLSSTCANNNFCDHNRLYDFLFYAIFGAVYIFTQVVLVEGPTCLKYVIFYVILFMENTIANIFWILYDDKDVKQLVYYMPIIYLNVIPFIFGIFFMVLYYKVFHPSIGCVRNQEIDC
ncbi:hypothetical protein NQ315_009326 [Exocentrus adspersus]|uniref:XK-related protein n=1 Tax=Exocentrus adspersus TaxID=1586481 RepID=A0AAV8WGJ7_9CUCU|nr:hypothetical protein NQ315_009326 [Exocentrus adspersus]